LLNESYFFTKPLFFIKPFYLLMQIKSFFGLLLSLLIINRLSAQDTPKDTLWRKNAQTGFSFNQATFSDNWKGGGVNSIALGLFFKAKANYKKGKISWDNLADLQYGIVKNKNQNLRKSNDIILLDSKVGYAISDHWNLFASVNFLSQFDAGFAYDEKATDPAPGGGSFVRDRLISKFLAPGYLSETMGLEYKPVDYFWIRFGLLSLRQTFVLEDRFNNNQGKNIPYSGDFDPQLNYGADKGASVRNEVGLLRIDADFNREIAKNLVFKAHLITFTTYKDPAATDVRLDAALIAKINKFANVSLGGILLYDQDQDLNVQINQALQMNFAYNFQ
jgi:hypothetical protein